MKLTTKQFFKIKTDYYVLDVEDLLDQNLLDMIDKILLEQAKGWFYSASSFWAFEKARDKNLVKSALSWDFIKNKLPK
tara:strand:- start:213 stop:446 length:234 start_codon:yes stop_codon:yes gene_type:complete